MTCTNAVVIALATELAAERAEGTTPPFNQHNTGGNDEGHAQDN
jgi:hypothetical protein